MKISDDQIIKVMRYIGAGEEAGPSSFRGGRCAPDPMFVEEIKQHLSVMPDVRDKRVRDLRARLDTYSIAPEVIAAKMIGRAIGDRLR